MTGGIWRKSFWLRMEIRRCCSFFLSQFVSFGGRAGFTCKFAAHIFWFFSLYAVVVMLRMPENEHIEASSSKNLVTLLETSKCTCALHYPVLIPGCSMTTLEPGGFTVWYRKTGESSQRLRSSTFMVERWWFHEASFCERPLWVQSLHAGEGRGEGLQIWVWWVFFGPFLGGQVEVGETLNFFVWWFFVYRTELLVESTQCRKCERMYHAACIYTIKKRKNISTMYLFTCAHGFSRNRDIFRDLRYTDIDIDIATLYFILRRTLTDFVYKVLGAPSFDVNFGSRKIFLKFSFGLQLLHGNIPSTFVSPPTAPTTTGASLAFLRMVLMTTVGAVLIDHSKLALVGIAYSTILKSWYPAYLRFNVYWNASMRCQWWDGWNMRAEGWVLWRLKDVEDGGMIRGVMRSG